VAALAASVLCVEAALGGIDNPDTFSRRPAPGACRFPFVKPAAASEALVSDMHLWTDGNGILDVVSAPAEGAGWSTLPGASDIVRRAHCIVDPR